jgi:hypothetical protein
MIYRDLHFKTLSSQLWDRLQINQLRCDSKLVVIRRDSGIYEFKSKKTTHIHTYTNTLHPLSCCRARGRRGRVPPPRRERGERRSAKSRQTNARDRRGGDSDRLGSTRTDLDRLGVVSSGIGAARRDPCPLHPVPPPPSPSSHLPPHPPFPLPHSHFPHPPFRPPISWHLRGTWAGGPASRPDPAGSESFACRAAGCGRPSWRCRGQS